MGRVKDFYHDEIVAMGDDYLGHPDDYYDLYRPPFLTTGPAPTPVDDFEDLPF